MPPEVPVAPVAATPVPATPVAPPLAVVETPSTPAEKPVSVPESSPVKAETVPEAPTPVPEPPATSLLATAGKEKPEEAKPKPEELKAPPVESAPIEYQPFTLPEGFTVDEKEMGEFKAALGEFKAPQELGQKIIDLYSKEMTRLAEYQQTQWQKTLDTWKNDVLADPELGGNRIQTVLQRCGSVLEQFGTPELRKMLDVSGMGNNIEMVRFVHKVAEFMGEPKPVIGKNPVPDKKPSRAERRYSRNGASASP